ncbi:hypothetical protein F5X68DRAFT_239121 [Plectosphaerella plurivora]|uniref:Uncharacterized protein n=1 Tax=Plectosphaerella plurivora TaxID=936078 RepID=A0A9P9AB99_9PEZI|nr:hypothetical protein F5X68DRAFT_239121 [Plectosphaerella plurivora]
MSWNTAKPVKIQERKSAMRSSQPKERRRQRRLLQESGDYLGVQGVNPQTGQLDVITPTPSNSSKSGTTLQTGRKMQLLETKAQAARRAYQDALDAAQEEAQLVLQERERSKEAKRNKSKESVRRAQSRVRWRRDPRQWSSAQEPDLSPIAQSVGTITPESTSPRRRSLAAVTKTTAPSKGGRERSSTQDTDGSDSSDTVIRTPARRRSSVLPVAAAEGLPQEKDLAAMFDDDDEDEASEDSGQGEKMLRRISIDHVKEGGQTCIHTHHHHYWLRPGTDVVPSRVDAEHIAELQRSPHRDSHTRHYINQMLARKPLPEREIEKPRYKSVASQTSEPEG